ncbi:hypothetical protein KIN20_025518 [Parelaphostrongylus tenuis]|uniref:Uncharacterized protein n=1 Tax=Parelaphostrongylus tenuis TaxID=148309 RepID=A0AAD5MVF4_PARTN|nr:hypothetical protein KIN20_025518 [Parelaphostrongylus tenuis]
MVAKPINSEHLSLSGTLTTTNIIMANWSRSMWQNVVDRALRLLRSGPFGSHLYTANFCCEINNIIRLVDFLPSTDDVAGEDHKRVSHEQLTSSSRKPDGRLRYTAYAIVPLKNTNQWFFAFLRHTKWTEL